MTSRNIGELKSYYHSTNIDNNNSSNASFDGSSIIKTAKSNKMKRIIISLLAFILPVLSVSAQGYNLERTALANFLTRMYENAPFEGVRMVDDYEHHYLMSTLSLDPAKYNGDESTMNRVAGVKAMSQASRFFNGSSITSDLIIRTTEKSDGTADTEMIENIKENSVGYVKALELLTSFNDSNGKKVFIYITEVLKQ